MTVSSLPHPKFASPPITELALSVQFESRIEFHVPHFGLLWERFRTEFPKTQEHPPLDRTTEEFGARPPLGIGVRLELMDEPPMPRCWFLNELETELIQVQRDRLIVNWRKGSGDEQYPLFERVQALFERAYNEFSAFVQQEQLGDLVPDQCEVTHADHIVGDGVWERHGQLDKVLTVWSPPSAEEMPLEAESARVAVQYVIPDDGGAPIGRLHVQVLPAYRRADDVPIIVMNTTARGRPVGDGLDGIRRFFAIGHEWAVRAFVALTTPQMHQVWGRRDG